MKYLYTIIILAVLVCAVWFWNSKVQTLVVANNTGFSSYTMDNYGISFMYPTDYVLEERNANGVNGNIYHQVIFTNKKDLPLPAGGEGPTAIVISFHPNSLDKYTAEDWSLKSKHSNLLLGGGKMSTTTISGFPAVSFRWSGLYEGTTIVLARPKWVYTFDVTYFEMGSKIVQDFVKIRDSVKITK